MFALRQGKAFYTKKQISSTHFIDFLKLVSMNPRNISSHYDESIQMNETELFIFCLAEKIYKLMKNKYKNHKKTSKSRIRK